MKMPVTKSIIMSEEINPTHVIEWNSVRSRWRNLSEGMRAWGRNVKVERERKRRRSGERGSDEDRENEEWRVRKERSKRILRVGGQEDEKGTMIGRSKSKEETEIRRQRNNWQRRTSCMWFVRIESCGGRARGAVGTGRNPRNASDEEWGRVEGTIGND